jgi:peptide chain release factor 2
VRDFSEELATCARRVADAHKYLRVDEARSRLEELNEIVADPELWNDPDQARRVTTEHARVREDVELVDGLDRVLSDLETLAELAREEGDESQEPEIAAGVDALRAQLDDLELRSLFTGDQDDRDAICVVNSGAGGTDAQDWAEKLLRMITRWGERRGFTVEIDEVQPGTEAGISSATFTVKGRYAYGLLQSERGVHRLIRISTWRPTLRGVPIKGLGRSPGCG